MVLEWSEQSKVPSSGPKHFGNHEKNNFWRNEFRDIFAYARGICVKTLHQTIHPLFFRTSFCPGTQKKQVSESPEVGKLVKKSLVGAMRPLFSTILRNWHKFVFVNVLLLANGRCEPRRAGKPSRARDCRRVRKTFWPRFKWLFWQPTHRHPQWLTPYPAKV